MTDILNYESKRVDSLFAICTLGLSAVPVAMIAKLNLFKDTSIDKDPALRVLARFFSFLFLTILTAVIMFILHLIKYIYYHFKVRRYCKIA